MTTRMSALQHRPVRALLAGLCLLAALPRAMAQDLSVSYSPERPRPGQDLIVTILVPDVEAPDILVEAGAGAAGMEFLSSAVTPQRGGARRLARVELGFRILSSGSLSTGPITVRAGSRSWPLEALRIQAGDAAAAARPEPAHWLAPDRVPLWSSFRIEAVDARGLPLEPASLSASGLFTMPDPAGGFLAVALESGLSTLPEKAPGLDQPFVPRSILVLDPPKAIRASRALGRLALSHSAGTRETAIDGAFTFELRLEGSGSLPMLRAPEFAVRGPRGPLPPSRIVLSRTDDYEARGGEYRGRVAFRVDILPLDPGAHRIAFEPYAVQDPATGLVRELRIPELRFEVLERPDLAAASAAFEALKAASLAELGSSRAARQVQAAFVSRLEGDEMAFLRALHAAERRPPLLGWRLGAPLKAALDAREAALRLPRRPSDRFAPSAFAPSLAAALAALLALLGLSLRGALSASGKARAKGRRSLVVLALALAAGACVLGLAALERRQDFCIARAGAARVVPEERSGPAFIVEHPAAARVRARAGSWCLVELEDGRSGWYPSDAVALY